MYNVPLSTASSMHVISIHQPDSNLTHSHPEVQSSIDHSIMACYAIVIEWTYG